MRAQEYNVGIYCRLSVDDGTNNESMSIGNQKSMLVDYVNKNGWNIEEIYIDDGWSGVNFDRPDFQRMINDIETSRINLVIVKDLSRLGRNYILCGQYTEIFFPSQNVRFIALNDGVDSLNSNNDIAPFKNILNDMYAKDISVKIRSALYAKARRGEYLGACDPYGYVRDPKDKHHLLINPDVAPVVRRMYEMAVNGYGLSKISKILNAEDILCPSDYNAFRNHDPADGEFTPICEWEDSSVRIILRNEMFIGNMVQCRKRSQSYRTQKIQWNPKEDWVIVNDTHEGIVSRELFDKAQNALKERTRIIKRSDEPSLFSGIFFCKDCGRRMAHHVRYVSKGDYYSCGMYRDRGIAKCTSHHVNVSDLYELVLADIQKNVKLLQWDEEKALDMITTSKYADEEKQIVKVRRELSTQKKRQFELDIRIKKAYEDNVSGKLPDDLFRSFLRDYEDERASLKGSIRASEEKAHTLESNKTDASQFVKLLKQYTDITELDRPTLLALVDKITVEEPAGSAGKRREQTLRIHYKYVGEL